MHVQYDVGVFVEHAHVCDDDKRNVCSYLQCFGKHALQIGDVRANPFVHFIRRFVALRNWHVDVFN